MVPFYGIFPAIRVAFRTRGFGLLGLLAFRKPPGFERRTRKIMWKIVKRHSKKMFRRVLVYGKLKASYDDILISMYLK